MDAQILRHPTDLLDENLLHDVKTRLIARGASDASVSGEVKRSFSTTVRNGKFEGTLHNEDLNLTLKAFCGNRCASVSTNDLSPEVISTMVDRVIRMAELASEDPFAGLPAPALLAPAGDDDALDLFDPEEPGVGEMESVALALESHALAVAGVTECEGATAGWSVRKRYAVASNGLSRYSRATSAELAINVIAGTGDGRETGGFRHAARWRQDLLPVADVGMRAGQYAVEKLGSRKVDGGRAPVIFDRRLAFSFVGSFLRAIGGDAIYHKQTYLPDALGMQLFPKGFTLTEDPFERRGLASRMTDDVGMPPFRGAIVDDGVVKTPLISYYDAKRLKQPSTGHSGGTSNLTILPGTLDRDGLMREAGRGLIVTGVMGFSDNPFTGDFSMGVSGLWFEGGEIAYPVSESTIAGNFKDLFGGIVVGSDIERLGVANSASILVPPLAMGGK